MRQSLHVSRTKTQHQLNKKDLIQVKQTKQVKQIHTATHQESANEASQNVAKKLSPTS